MKKVACLLVTASFLSGGAVFAQGELDAYRYSQPENLSGTARYLSMGGAFGALGGDISAMTSNPAGLGIYRSSEVVTTLSLSAIKTKSDWNGSLANASKTKFNFDNIAYVGYFPTGNDEGLVSWNVGFSYNRAKSFDRTYRLSGRQAYSLGDYAAAKASYIDKDNQGWFGISEKDLAPLLGKDADQAYEKLGGQWIPGLAYQSGIIGSYNEGGDLYHSAFGEWENNNWINYSPDDVQLNVVEKGAVDKYNLAFATNISNMFFLGATVSITDLKYTLSSTYDEYFGGEDHLYWDNSKKTDGTGYALNVGAIVRPSDYFRLGVAYNSPTWYKMTDYYRGEAGSHIQGLEDMNGATPSAVYTDYKLRTSDKWIFSAAGVIGQVALISVDYELANYKHMNLSDPDGYEYNDNELIREDFGLAHSVKVGAEVKVTPQFAIRAGGGWQSSPMKQALKDGDLQVYPSGTVTNFTLDKGTAHYSVGFGYRFTPNFYADLACVYSERKEDAYAFSKVIVDDKLIVDSNKASLKTNTTRVALTLGYKF